MSLTLARMVGKHRERRKSQAAAIVVGEKQVLYYRLLLFLRAGPELQLKVLWYLELV